MFVAKTERLSARVGVGLMCSAVRGPHLHAWSCLRLEVRVPPKCSLLTSPFIHGDDEFAEMQGVQ